MAIRGFLQHLPSCNSSRLRKYPTFDDNFPESSLPSVPCIHRRNGLEELIKSFEAWKKKKTHEDEGTLFIMGKPKQEIELICYDNDV